MIALPAAVESALELASELGILKELGEAIVEIVKGDLVAARLRSEEAAIRAASRAPYLEKKV
jgi:hypothetical protein